MQIRLLFIDKSFRVYYSLYLTTFYTCLTFSRTRNKLPIYMEKQAALLARVTTAPTGGASRLPSPANSKRRRLDGRGRFSGTMVSSEFWSQGGQALLSLHLHGAVSLITVGFTTAASTNGTLLIWIAPITTVAAKAMGREHLFFRGSVSSSVLLLNSW